MSAIYMIGALLAGFIIGWNIHARMEKTYTKYRPPEGMIDENAKGMAAIVEAAKLAQYQHSMSELDKQIKKDVKCDAKNKKDKLINKESE